jgi:hypothetical protein
MAPTLRARVGAIAWAMSKFVHPSKPICDQYPNQPKNHKLEGIILLREDDKVVRRGTDPIPVFLFRHKDFPDKEFYCARQYVHVTQEGPESSLFVPPPPIGVPMETLATGEQTATGLVERKRMICQVYFLAVRQIYCQRTWPNFDIKGSPLTTTMTQHRRTFPTEEQSPNKW